MYGGVHPPYGVGARRKVASCRSNLVRMREHARWSRCTTTCQRMVRTGPDVGIEGDSGGGWSWGTTVYGLHYGNCGSNREGFSLAIALDSALGVTVRTQ